MIGRALNHVLKHNFKPSTGMRPDAKKKLILATGGNSLGDVETHAQNLKDSGIEIYVIGVGRHVHTQYTINQLRTIASEDTENHLYLLSTDQSFHNAAINISRNLCQDDTNPEKQELQADQTNSTDNIAPLKGYSKTEGTMVLSENRNQYAVKSVTECAAKCDSETSFTCKSFAYLEQNQECWTWASNSKTGPVVQNWNSVLYEKNKYLLECVNEKGADYRGTVNWTKSGKLCQRWDAMFPHKAMFTQEHRLADLESNFCRNPLGILRSPWCYTTDPETVWELCDIPSCTEECMHCRGEDYKGKISVTENGFTCQRWDSQIPHNHGFFPTVFPEKFLEENYCRNPNADSRPWCYTSSPSRRWDYCSIPRCTSEPPSIMPELSCITGNGESYRGTIAVTTSGKKCQRWASQTPHRHDYTPESYPCSHLVHNFCRNPGKDQRPWCYTTDPETRWEYCNVSRCADTSNSPEPEATFDDAKVKGYSKTEGAMVVSVKGGKYSVKSVTECAAKCNNETSFLCKSFAYVEKDHECWTTASNSKTGTVVHRASSILYERIDFLLECVEDNGTDYRGKQAKTKSGKLCQRWDADTPHNPMFKPENYPLADLDSNFCRNPNSKSQGPWCYTTDPDTVWEYCNIPSCAEDCMQPGVDVYKGKTFITENGFICQRWDSLEPHSHGYTPKVFPNKFLEENYCRNPNGDSRPWCYTTSPSKRWDYCSIPPCNSNPEQVCITGRGEAYRGIVGVTASGKPCQKWAAQTPHYHPDIVPQRFPNADLDKNYCRNPDGRQKPWCFTTDNKTRWEYCSLPNCNDILASGECMHCNGEDYRGNVSWTRMGFTCQRWDSQTPHKPNYGGQTVDENYCRNPRNDLLPWCYTTDPAKRWDYCAIPRCSSAPPAIIPELNCMTGYGKNYRGTISVTENGNKCKRWSETSYTPELYPCSGLDNNYCRNVLENNNQPWCYTHNKWENCNVPQCSVYSIGDD
ncbi:PREDICTED: plasminogen-like isoform X3 [Poecilia mexicana]|uniref:plasminogen-like isoform X3 n=1 Tax=Poecilia mexicana TaxID=48701 RepID=UPI00072E5D5D|nr:PREDICTED: plasminogen-like isoform X3 [Poecilia mexicana]